jgi:hypothetical protein
MDKPSSWFSPWTLRNWHENPAPAKTAIDREANQSSLCLYFDATDGRSLAAPVLKRATWWLQLGTFSALTKSLEKCGALKNVNRSLGKDEGTATRICIIGPKRTKWPRRRVVRCRKLMSDDNVWIST